MDLVSAIEKQIVLFEFGYPWMMKYGYDIYSSLLHSGATFRVLDEWDFLSSWIAL